MMAICLVAYLLGSSIGLTPVAQTPSPGKPKVSASYKQPLRGKNKVDHPAQLTQAQLLQGAWAECAACDFNFSLQGNRVLFYDPGTEGKQEVVHWTVANHHLSFHYKGGSVVTDAIVKLTKDSLVLYRRDKAAGVVGYSRFIRLK
jgi:hypothetical protein